MRSITRLFSAVGTLADSLLSLASVVNTATDKLRLTLAGEVDPLALPHNGEVIDNNAEPAANPKPRRKNA